MKKVAKAFKGGTVSDIWKPLVGQPICEHLQDVANAFIELQEARHEADYNMARTFSRNAVRDLIEMSEKAINGWPRISRSQQARVFLSSGDSIHNSSSGVPEFRGQYT
jgi:hypothetical protein